MRMRLAAGVILVLCRSVFGQGTDVDIPYQKFVLKNGLTLIVHEDHKAPIVAFNVWYHVGSKNEKPGKTGFAHLFEHLMFGGSQHHMHRYIEVMEPLGATDLNGTTSNDRTNYFEMCRLRRWTPRSGWNRIAWVTWWGRSIRRRSICSVESCRTRNARARTSRMASPRN
jgi:hypothetical protein